MVVVSDTSVIWYLSEIGRLNLLQSLYAEVVIPHKVKVELLAAVSGNIKNTLDETPWIKVMRPKDVSILNQFIHMVDEGELSAFALAIELNADLVLVDDSDARKLARHLDLPYTGLVGIEAYRNGLLTSVESYIEDLRAKGFWISNALMQELKKHINE